MQQNLVKKAEPRQTVYENVQRYKTEIFARS